MLDLEVHVLLADGPLLLAVHFAHVPFGFGKARAVVGVEGHDHEFIAQGGEYLGIGPDGRLHLLAVAAEMALEIDQDRFSRGLCTGQSLFQVIESGQPQGHVEQVGILLRDALLRHILPCRDSHWCTAHDCPLGEIQSVGRFGGKQRGYVLQFVSEKPKEQEYHQ